MGKNTDIAALQGTFIIMSTKRDCRFRMPGYPEKPEFLHCKK